MEGSFIIEPIGYSIMIYNVTYSYTNPFPFDPDADETRCNERDFVSLDRARAFASRLTRRGMDVVIYQITNGVGTKLPLT